MNIKCESCQSIIKVPDSFAGKRGKCPKCGKIIDITSLTHVSVSDSPATEKQKEYGNSLGIDFPPNISKQAISALISEAVEKNYDERLSKLNQLQDRESKYYEQIRNEVLAEIDEEDIRLSKADTSQMVEELANRDEGAILITFPIDEIDFDNLEGAKFSVSFSDNLSDSQMRAIIFGLSSVIAKQAGL